MSRRLVRFPDGKSKTGRRIKETLSPWLQNKYAANYYQATSPNVINLKKLKAALERHPPQPEPKVDHRGRVFTYIPAGMASAAPPLGSQLGQIGVNIPDFVRDFNLRTSIFKEGIPIPSVITLNPDRTHKLVMSHPPFSYFLKQAAGIQRGAMDYRIEVVGKITRKHVYEIAKLKSNDPYWQMFDLQDICKAVVDSAYTIGIKVVEELDPVEYRAFLDNQLKVVERQKAEIQAIREAKLLRTAAQT